MKAFYDYKLYSILYVDDEAMSLRYFKRNFENAFAIMTARSASEAFQLFELHKDDIAILIADQRMPGTTGVELLAKAREQRPNMIRMLTTAYSEIDVAIAAVNAGAIYKYIVKPWDISELEATLMRAMEVFMIESHRDALVGEKISVLHRLLMTDRLISLVLLACGLRHHPHNAVAAIRAFLDLTPEANIDVESVNNPKHWLAFYKTAHSQRRKLAKILDSLGSTPIAPLATFDDQVKLSEIAILVAKSSGMRQEWRDTAIQVHASASERLVQVNKSMFCRLFDLLFESLSSISAKGSVVCVLVTEDSESGSVRVEFSGHGLRLPKGFLRQVFDPFNVPDTISRDAEMNLLFCYFIVHYHRGKLMATVEGTDVVRYTITLPSPTRDGNDQ
jgi:two-component system probable response regulator PhcQ